MNNDGYVFIDVDNYYDKFSKEDYLFTETYYPDYESSMHQVVEDPWLVIRPYAEVQLMKTNDGYYLIEDHNGDWVRADRESMIAAYKKMDNLLEKEKNEDILNIEKELNNEGFFKRNKDFSERREGFFKRGTACTLEFGFDWHLYKWFLCHDEKCLVATYGKDLAAKIIQICKDNDIYLTQDEY